MRITAWTSYFSNFLTLQLQKTIIFIITTIFNIFLLFNLILFFGGFFGGDILTANSGIFLKLNNIFPNTFISWIFPYLRDNTEISVSILKSILIDVGLVALFIGIHHHMTDKKVREMFSESLVFNSSYRSIFNSITSILLYGLMKYWEPVNIFIWNYSSSLESWYPILGSLRIFGLIQLAGELFLLWDPLEFFGLSYQINDLLANPSPKEERSKELTTLFEHSRHPILFGLLFVFYSTPKMSLDRFLLGTFFLLYILLRNQINSKDVRFVRKYEDNEWRNWLLQTNPISAYKRFIAKFMKSIKKN